MTLNGGSECVPDWRLIVNRRCRCSRASFGEGDVAASLVVLRIVGQREPGGLGHTDVAFVVLLGEAVAVGTPVRIPFAPAGAYRGRAVGAQFGRLSGVEVVREFAQELPPLRRGAGYEQEVVGIGPKRREQPLGPGGNLRHDLDRRSAPRPEYALGRGCGW